MTSRPMCDCPETAHQNDCLFYDPEVDEEPYRRPDLHSMTDAEFDRYCADNGVTALGAGTQRPFSFAEHAVDLPGRQNYATWWENASVRQCRHDFDLFELPTGQTVRLSAWSDVPNDRTLPDVGIYLDRAWQPSDVFGYAIGWEDFGLPTMSIYDVVRTARHALQHIEYGETVEIGCLGAHGRTGSFLAILCLVASSSNLYRTMSGVAAVRYVRDNHCKLAIETKQQERYISRIAGMLKRGEV